MKLKIDTSEKTSTFHAEETGQFVTIDYHDEIIATLISEVLDKSIANKLNEVQYESDEVIGNEICKEILKVLGINVVVKHWEENEVLLTELYGNPTKLEAQNEGEIQSDKNKN
jgi:hypothetical protein